MAIIENGLLKGSHGRLDEFIIYQYREKTCIRRKPDKSQIRLTPEMLEQQERMAGVVALYQAVKAVGIYCLWQNTARGRGVTGYNLLVKYNQKAFSGRGVITDFHKLFLTVGPLQLPDRMSLVPAGAGEWVLAWNNDTPYPNTREDDRLVVVLMKRADRFTVKVPDIGAPLRKECRAVIRIAPGLEDYTHLFCYFCSATGREVSVSRYFPISNNL